MRFDPEGQSVFGSPWVIRIVEIQDLFSEVIGVERRSNLMEEQKMLWEDFFLGQPYERIVWDAVDPAYVQPVRPVAHGTA